MREFILFTFLLTIPCLLLSQNYRMFEYEQQRNSDKLHLKNPVTEKLNDNSIKSTLKNQDFQNMELFLSDQKILDSIVRYNFNSISDSIPSYINTYIYNHNDKLSKVYNFQWNTVLNNWQENTQSEFFYDDKDRRTGDAYYSWDKNISGWIAKSKHLDYLDDFDRILISEDYSWNSETSDWQIELKEEHNYMDTITISITSELDFNSNNLEFLSKIESIYWSNDKLKEVKNYNWVEELNNWLLNSYTEYNYDEMNNRDSIIEYFVIGEDTINESKKIVLHSENNEKAIEYKYFWNPDSSVWDNYSKTETIINEFEQIKARYQWLESINNWSGIHKSITIYNLSGNQTEITDYTWDRENTDWVYSGRFSFKYDTNSNQIQKIIQDWDKNEMRWVNYSKVDYFFDEDNNQTSYIWYKGDQSQEQDDWKLNAKNFFYYKNPVSDHSLYQFNTILAYPIPASDLLYLSNLKDNIKYNVKIFSSSGILIKNEFLDASNPTLNVNTLSSGIYILKVQNPLEEKVIRFLIR